MTTLEGFEMLDDGNLGICAANPLAIRHACICNLQGNAFQEVSMIWAAVFYTFIFAVCALFYSKHMLTMREARRYHSHGKLSVFIDDIYSASLWNKPS